MRMIDGALYLEKGEQFPFICPACNDPIPFDEALKIIICPKCQKTGTPADFTKVGFVLAQRAH